MNPWFILQVAGLFEVGFTTCMKLSKGFTQLHYTLGFLFFSGISLFLLNKAVVPYNIRDGMCDMDRNRCVWNGFGRNFIF